MKPKNTNGKTDLKGDEAFLKKNIAEQVSIIFRNIDDKIISLHQCSSDDFLQLGAHFKTYYKESKTISQNADSIYDLNAGKKAETIANRLEDMYKNFQSVTQNITNEISGDCRNFKEMIHKLNLIKIPVNNFNQNLVTLKLVATNLELGSSYYKGSKRRKTYESSCHIRQLISNIKEIYPTFINVLDDIQVFFQSSVCNLEKIQGKALYLISEIMNDIEIEIEHTRHRRTSAGKTLPGLKEKTEHTSKSIARIITNLQYHDIIRQKIDHIQQTHKEIIKDLNLLASRKDDKGLEKVDFFNQIRDIAGLQAAQLIHANKEYQKAIDIIILMFLDIGDDMKAISNMCHEISGFDQTDEDTQTQIRKRCTDKVNLFVGILKKYEKSMLELVTIGNTRMHSLDEILNRIMLLDLQLDSISLKAVNEMNENHEIFKELNQIKALSVDIKTEYDNLQVLSKSISKLAGLSFKKISDTQEAGNKETINNIIHLMHSISSSLNKTKVRTNGLLHENREKSEMITKDIKDSIDKIKYYDVFEREAEEIIKELNVINLILSEDKEETIKKKTIDLHFLKDKYTMASEHIIHDKIARAKPSEKNKNIKIRNGDEVQDNIEFF